MTTLAPSRPNCLANENPIPVACSGSGSSTVVTAFDAAYIARRRPRHPTRMNGRVRHGMSVRPVLQLGAGQQSLGLAGRF